MSSITIDGRVGSREEVLLSDPPASDLTPSDPLLVRGGSCEESSDSCDNTRDLDDDDDASAVAASQSSLTVGFTMLIS